MIYLDNAATTGKKPISVIKAINSANLYYCANPGRSGHKTSVKAAEKIYETRNKVMEYFGGNSPEQVVFTSGCTHSINYVLKGILKRGDKVIVSDLEHNAVMRPLHKIEADIKVFDVSLYDDKITLENLKKQIDYDTKLIICTAASNVCGKILPIKEIGKTAKEKNIPFLVDGAQLCGVLPINMTEINIDYLAVAAHKGLYSAMGNGILIARKDIKDTIIEGGTGTDSINLSQPDTLPEKFESGTVNVSGIFSINAGIDFVKNSKNLYLHEQKLIQKIYDELNRIEGILLYTPYPEEYKYAPVLSFNIEKLNSQTVANILDKNNIAVRAGLHCAPSAHNKLGTLDVGTVRVSTSVFNNFNEINYFIKTVKKIVKNRKKYVET